MGRLALLLLTIPVMAQELFTVAPTTRTMTAGEKHVYRFSAQAGQFLDIRCEQIEGDISITLAGPDGTGIAEQNSLSMLGTEVIFRLAKTAGEYRIEVSAPPKAAAEYRLAAAARTPTEADGHRLKAFTLHLMEANRIVHTRKGGTFREAGEKMTTALAEWRAAGEPALEAAALNMAGLVSLMLGENPKARGLFEQATAQSRGQEGQGSTLSAALNNLGQILLNTGQLEQAVPVFEESIALHARHGIPGGEASALNNYATLLRRLGEHDRALEMIKRALELQRQAGNQTGELIAMQGLSATYMETRNFQAALELALEGLQRARALGSVVGEFVALRGLATTYHALGEYAQALPHYERAEAMARQTNSLNTLSSLLAAHSVALWRLNDIAKARKQMDDAVEMGRSTTDKQAMAFNLVAACTLFTDTGEYGKARAIATEALAVTKQASPGNGYARALLCAAKLDAQEKQYGAAAAKLGEAAEAAARRTIRVELLDELAKLEQLQGRTLPALRYTEEAAALAETTRSEIVDPTLRASNGALGAERVWRHTELLMALHRKDPEGGYGERAFQVTERARARTLAEMITDSTGYRNELLPKAEANREDKLLAGIAAAQRELFRDGLGRARQAELREKLRKAESEYDLFQAGLPRAKAQTLAEPMDAAGLRAGYLGADTALMAYALGTAESYGWVVTREGVQSVTLAGRAVIEKRAGELRAILTKPVNTLTAAVEAAAKELRRLVVDPMEAYLRGKKRLVVVPDGPLHAVPFEALGMLERYAIRYAPSASTLAALRRRGGGRAGGERTLLALADPVAGPAANERGFVFAQLPNARNEVRSLEALFGSSRTRVLLGEAASERSLKGEDLKGFRYLHFATHGYFDEASPGRSGLVLARGSEDDGFLQAREIFGLKLNADVVTLSACQTGLGKLVAGEGVMGLSRAFFYAGAQSVVVSLWNVNDAATAELMKVFYGGMKANLGRDEALRRAKISMARGENRTWRHPYFWAPFVLMGESD